MRATAWRRIAALGAVIACAVGGGARADCPPDWRADFVNGDVNSTILAMMSRPEGTSQALYIGGSFSYAGAVPVTRIARYDGRAWTPLGAGLNNSVNAIVSHNDGSGSAVFAAGLFTVSGTGTGQVLMNRVGKWDGSQWRSLGTGTANGLNGAVNALAVFNGQLIAAGAFSTAGGGAAANIAAWNGAAWSPLAGGLNGTVETLLVADEGGQTRLFAGGSFTGTGAGTNFRGVARWDGAAWTAMGQGFSGTGAVVNALEVFGGSIHAAGVFSTSGTTSLSNVARWTGTAWADVNGGVNLAVQTMRTFDDGAGSALYLGGNFTTATAGTVPVVGIARWNGSAYQSIGNTNSVVWAMTPYNDGNGTALFFGGQFTTVATPAVLTARLAKWNGVILSGPAKGPMGEVHALAPGGSGATARLLVAGLFSRVNGMQTSGVAAYDGAGGWTTFGTGAFDQPPLAVHDFGGTVYIGGGFTTYAGAATARFARWTGSTWAQVGSVNSTVTNFAEYQGSLYLGGAFTSPGLRIARYDGSTLTAVGTGMNNTVQAMTPFNGQLIAGGLFTTAGGTAANRIAAWNGSAWSPLGNGLNNGVNALAVLGNELFVGGTFTTAGTIAASRVARWNGTQWLDAAGGMNASVDGLVVINASGRPTLYAIGAFTLASGLPANHVARWTGCRWTPVGDGFPNDPVAGAPVLDAITAVETGPAQGVYIGGTFVRADTAPSSNVARLGLCFDCPADIDNGAGTGRADGGVTIEDLLYFVTVYGAGDIRADLDDGSGTGSCDGGVTIEDLLYYLARFNAGC